MESNISATKIEANPYGYKTSARDPPSSGHATVCVAGLDVKLYVPFEEVSHNYEKNPSYSRKMEVKITYKKKTANCKIITNELPASLGSNTLAELKQPGYYKKLDSAVEKYHAYILQIGKFDENDVGLVFDSTFLLTVATDNVMRYMLLNNIKKKGEPIPDQIFYALGKWIGSVVNATVKEGLLNLHKLSEVIKTMSESISSDYTIPDKKVLQQQQQFLADARWCPLKSFTAHKLDALATKDPLGNTVAHLAVLNHNSEVFPYIAKKYPALLTAQNVFGNTPLHNLSLLRVRQSNAEYFEWPYIWSLPWDYALKNKKDQTALEKLCEMSGDELVKAFSALFDNKQAWQSVQKCHDVSKLLSAALVRFIINASVSDDEGVAKAKLFIQHGANGKDNAVLNAALAQRQELLAQYLLGLGAEVTFDSMKAAFDTKHRPVADIVLQRFDLDTLSKEQLSALCDPAVDATWIDILTLLANRGGSVPVTVNNRDTTCLPAANLVARMNWPGTLPLKYLCVDTIGTTADEEKQKKLIQTLPEELRAIFHEKDSWRWTLFLADEKARSRFLQLYNAVSAAQKVTENMEQLQISIGDVVFSVKSLWKEDWRKLKNVGLQIWPGKLAEMPKDTALIYEIVDYTRGDPRKSMKPQTFSTEKNHWILGKITDALDWPEEDTYVFLTLCYNGFLLNQVSGHDNTFSRMTPESIKVKQFFFPHPIHQLVAPPKWYENFIKDIYGVIPPINRSYKKRRFEAKKSDADSDANEDSNSDADSDSNDIGGFF